LVNQFDPGNGGLVFDWLTQEVSQSPATYPVVAFAAAADVLFPLIPSETIVITAGVLAAQGDLLVWLLVPAVALGAFLGDNLCYLLGARSATRSPTGSSLTRRARRGCNGPRKRWRDAARS
jgi:membrane protein DedA with SNARE-associated domain